MKKTYYDPETGYSGVQDLMRKTGKRKREVEEFLQKQETYTLHKPAVRKFQTRRVYVDGIDHQFQADLVDMRALRTKNKYHNYILNVIDCFSKYAWSIPVKKKTGVEITNAFTKLFRESNRIPLRLNCDKGLEFINKNTQALFKKLGIQFFASENTTKAQIVERLNRTLKDRMYKYFTANKTQKWLWVLPQIVKNYNTSYHRSIKMTPEEASLAKNENSVRENLYGEKIPNKKPKFKVEDLVRISHKDDVFRRGYHPNYTSEVFVIDKVLPTRPPTYKLKDFKDEEITSSFYEPELSRVIV